MERFYDENKIGQILGGEFLNKLKDKKERLQLDLSLSNFEITLPIKFLCKKALFTCLRTAVQILVHFKRRYARQKLGDT